MAKVYGLVGSSRLDIVWHRSAGNRGYLQPDHPDWFQWLPNLIACRHLFQSTDNLICCCFSGAVFGSNMFALYLILFWSICWSKLKNTRPAPRRSFSFLSTILKEDL